LGKARDLKSDRGYRVATLRQSEVE